MGGQQANSSTVLQAAEWSQKDELALRKRLVSYESAVEDKNSVMRIVFATKKHEFITGWAEDLELALQHGVAPSGLYAVKEINAYIRRKLESNGLERAIPYAKEVLAAKYKQHDKNPGAMEDILHENTSLNTKDFSHENEWYIHLLEEYKQALNLLITKMKTGHFTKLILARRPLESEEQAIKRGEEFEETMRMQYAMVLLLHEMLDDRQGVPAATMHMLILWAMKINIDEAATYYFNDVKDKNELTRKRTRQIVYQLIRGAFTNDGVIDWHDIKALKGKLHIALEPKTKWQARLLGFVGHQCPNCACWRVHYKYYAEHEVGEPEWQDYCFGCTKWFIAPLDEFYRNPNEVTILPISKGPAKLEDDKLVDGDGKTVAVIQVVTPKAE